MRRGILAGWPVRAEMMEQAAVGEQTAAVTVDEVRPVGPPPPMPPPMLPPEFPPDREVWPWLVSLLALVVGGIAAVYFATRDDHNARRPAVTQTVVQKTRPAVQRTTPVTTVSRKAALPARVTVPRLVGLPAPTALAWLQKIDLSGTTRGVFSTKPRNQVVSQKPGASRKLAKGTTVTLNVSKGPKAAPVPDVVGQGTADALTTIRAQGFKGTLVRVPSDQQTGQVLAQHPKAGSKAQSGSAIRLNISGGAKPSTPSPSVTKRTLPTTTTAPAAAATTATGSATRSPAPATSSVTVPDLEGKTLIEARKLLRPLGLVIEIRRVPNSLPRDTIVAQARKQGTTLKRSDHLFVTVSSSYKRASAQSITVPDVTGQEAEGATQDLERAGLVVRVVDQETTDPAEDGVVVDQTPAANQSAPAKSTVTIYVGRYNGG